MKVLVTGASGFLGGHIVELLSKRGDGVRALVRSTSNRKHLEGLPNVELFEAAVEEVERVREAVDGVDAIVHTAGLTKARSTDEFFAVNVGGTSNLIQAARTASRVHPIKRFVYVSSLVACGPSPDGSPVPLDQETPVNAYGRSKLAAEKVVLSAKDDLPVVVLRPGAIYGPRDGEILDVFKSIQWGLLPLVAGGEAKGVWIYATDCAEVCIRAIDANIEAFGRVTNRAVMLTPEKARMLLMHWVCSSEATRAALGWQPKVLRKEGMERAVAWYRANGWL
jgi:nucleoside-diphosphate-sugar epimerase